MKGLRARLQMLLTGSAVVLLLLGTVACGAEPLEAGSSPSTAPATVSPPPTSAADPASSSISATPASPAQGATPTSAAGRGEADAPSQPLGQEAEAGAWRVKVVDVVLDADEIVLNHSEFNEAPPPGEQYVLVKVEAVRTGEAASAFWADTICVFVGSGGDTFDAGWADVPDALSETGDVAPGGSVSGCLVFLVPSQQVAGGTLGMSAAASSVRVHFAVD